MFLKICHYDEDEPSCSPSYSLYEGKHVETIWRNDFKETPMRFIVDGVFVDIPNRKKTIYIMNNEGKTIEKIDHKPTHEMTPEQIKERDKLQKQAKKLKIVK